MQPRIPLNQGAEMQRMSCSFRLAALGLVCVLSVGCSGKGQPTKKNFDKIKEGMSVQQVEDLMGAPRTALDQSRKLRVGEEVAGMPKLFVHVWEEGDTQYHVTFFDDRVKAKD